MRSLMFCYVYCTPILAASLLSQVSLELFKILLYNFHVSQSLEEEREAHKEFVVSGKKGSRIHNCKTWAIKSKEKQDKMLDFESQKDHAENILPNTRGGVPQQRKPPLVQTTRFDLKRKMEAKVISLDTDLLQEFEDILKDEIPHDVDNNNDASEDEETVIPIQNANHLTLKDLLHSLEKRGINPRGFFDEDAKVLQVELDREHDEYMESKRREKQESKALESSQRLIRRRKALTEIALKEEKQEMMRNERIMEWFLLIKNGIAPLHCRISVNDASARSLSRLLWSDSRIVSLDLSNLNLSDASGAFIARMLKNNRSIVKLEMGDNMLGDETCTTMAASLHMNSVLQYLSLESNPLTKAGSVAACEALSAMIRANNGLRYLSLWRCNIGAEGGRLISEAAKSNSKLACLEIGYNQWQCADIIVIKKIVSNNALLYQEELDAQLDVERKEQETKDLLEQQQKQNQKYADDAKWLEVQKLKREEERRIEMEKTAAKAERMKEQELKRLEHEKKSKKNKKKGKKKKVRVRVVKLI